MTCRSPWRLGFDAFTTALSGSLLSDNKDQLMKYFLMAVATFAMTTFCVASDKPKQPSACGKVLEGFVQIPMDGTYWTKLELRNTYRRMLHGHLMSKGMPLTQEANKIITAYLNTLIPLPGMWVKFYWHDAGWVLGNLRLVYNPVTKKVEEKYGGYSKVAGIFNPLTGKVEWNESGLNGSAGVFNPITGETEWKTTGLANAAGIFNPLTGTVHWEEGSLGKIYATFNPISGSIEVEGKPKRIDNGWTLGHMNSMVGVVEVYDSKE